MQTNHQHVIIPARSNEKKETNRRFKANAIIQHTRGHVTSNNEQTKHVRDARFREMT